MTTTYNGRLIHIVYSPKPIPSIRFDWTATFDDYDAGAPVGYGPTADEALTDLIDQIEADSTW